MPFPPPQPTATFPYRLEGKVGEGAMGVVYRAIEPELDRPVAIKVMRAVGDDPTATREARLRFLQEARAAAALSHPGVATIYRIGEEAGEPWMAMEWLDGQTLEQVVLQGGPLPADQVARLGGEILSALGAAHRAGVIHRDVKPANLILLSDGRLKVTDFGIARFARGELVKTQVGYLVATPRFASPEQLRGLEVDERSDLFSAGVVLFHLLTGQHPFPGRDLMEIVSSILLGRTHSLRDLAPAVPEGLVAVLDRALASDPVDRFATAEEMAAALQAFRSPPTLSFSAMKSLPSETSSLAAAVDVPKTPLFRDLPDDLSAAVISVVGSWPGRDLGVQSSASLLERLLDRPLHATPFAGALRLGADWFLIADGQVLAAFGATAGAIGDVVLEGLPERADAAIHAAPTAPTSPNAPTAEALVAALAATSGEVRVRHDGLDSSFVNLPALAERLQAERFSGALVLEHRGRLGRVLFVEGDPVVRLWQRGWEGLPIERPWEELAASVSLRARVEETALPLIADNFRRAFAKLDLEVIRERGTTRTAPRTALAGGTSPALRFERDPLARFFDWALTSLPAFFSERERAPRWKYLVEWLGEVHSARLYSALPRPSGSTTDSARFDLATFDDGKPAPRVLHVVRRVARATPAALEAFREAVVEAKLARKATGDIGGAFLIAPEIDPATVALLAEWTRGEGSGKWFGVEESFTRYEGFVRISPRRGFHLLLVRETADGFAPLLPTSN